MYGQRMAMDPRFAYRAHMPRHGDPNYNRLPHNFNIQVYIHDYIIVNQWRAVRFMTGEALSPLGFDTVCIL